jgi:ribosome-associated protein YbcJ (S4-like RNA binding protein)
MTQQIVGFADYPLFAYAASEASQASGQPAGTLASLLTRNHLIAHEDGATRFLAGAPVLVNGLPTTEARRILYRGDVVDVDGTTYTV